MFYESQLHPDNCFITLTYSQENLPADGTLVPSDLQLFIKRLRRAVEPTRLRYFAVGEYGDESRRPHYHAIIFGLGPSAGPIVDQAWGLGFTATAEFNEYTAQYTAGYVVKKLTRRDDPQLNGRHPEFARMSLRPGIGADAMEILARSLGSGAGLDHIARTGDVPVFLTIGRRHVPIGRYLRQKLREHVGMPEGWNDAAKAQFSHKQQKEVQAMWIGKGGGKGNSTLTTKQVILEKNAGKFAQIEWRAANTQKKDTKL